MGTKQESSLSARNKKGPIGPLLFLKAKAGDKKPPGFDQTRPSERLEPSRKADESRHLTNDSAVAITLRGDRLVSANLRMSLSIRCSPSGVPLK